MDTTLVLGVRVPLAIPPTDLVTLDTSPPSQAQSLPLAIGAAGHTPAHLSCTTLRGSAQQNRGEPPHTQVTEQGPQGRAESRLEPGEGQGVLGCGEGRRGHRTSAAGAVTASSPGKPKTPRPRGAPIPGRPPLPSGPDPRIPGKRSNPPCRTLSCRRPGASSPRR